MRTKRIVEDAGLTEPDAHAGAELTWYSRPRSRTYWATLLGVTLAAALGVMRLLTFSEPMPDYWRSATHMAATGVMDQRFTPSAYAAWIALALDVAHGHPVLGFEVEGLLVQVAIVLLAWATARRLGASAGAALLCGLLMALHPELLLTVTKVWDVGLSVVTLLLLVWVSLRILQDGISWPRLMLGGVAWALGCFDRPNYVLFALPLCFVLWRAARPPAVNRLRGIALPGAALLLVTAAVFTLSSVAVYGSLVFPQNGPYNLYAGQNPFSEEVLLRDLNAESAIVPALNASGMQAATADTFNLALRPFYTKASIEFAEHRPWQEARLVVVKLYTLLRADTKLHKAATPFGLIKLLLALPVPLWLLAVVWFRSRTARPWTSEDTCICAFALVYVIPFLLTNSDPRFRTPLDVLLIAHTSALLSRGRGA